MKLTLAFLAGCVCTGLLVFIFSSHPGAPREFVFSATKTVGFSDRDAVLAAYPELLPPLMDGFGGDFSRPIAQNIFAATQAGVADAYDMIASQEVAPGLWFVRMPLVNASVVEFEKSLLVVDTGTRAAGPALLQEIRAISNKPVTHVVFTHGHVDHAFGATPIIEAFPQAEIIAHKNLPKRFERYLETRGLTAKLMSQPLDQLPADRSEFIWPTQTFDTKEVLEIDGDEVWLYHFPGETDDQLFVWLPRHRTVLAADYVQGFLPNAGNGKRVQRFVKEWTEALRAMAALEPEILLPGHGEAMLDKALIQDSLLSLADALTHIRETVIDSLNNGLRPDEATARIELPPHLQERFDLRETYVATEDVAKMVARRYTGWWNGIPSTWSPAPQHVQADDLVRLMGGSNEVLAETQALLDAGELQRASHLIDLVNATEANNVASLRMTIEVYRQRLLDDAALTQERLVYLDEIVRAHAALAAISD